MDIKNKQKYWWIAKNSIKSFAVKEMLYNDVYCYQFDWYTISDCSNIIRDMIIGDGNNAVYI